MLSSVYDLAHSGFSMRCCPMAKSHFMLALETLPKRCHCSLAGVSYLPDAHGYMLVQFTCKSLHSTYPV